MNRQLYRDFGFAAYDLFMQPRCDMRITRLGPIIKIDLGCV